ncbi:hypothetical protein QU39_00170, partial [Staphylococcus aureus]
VLQRAGLAAPVLLRGADLRAELGRRVPGPARVVEHDAGERDRVRPALGEDRLGLSRLGDESDGDGGEPRLGLDARGVGHLIARPELDRLLRRDAAGGDVDRRGAALLQGGGQRHGVLDVPAVLDPVGGRDPHPDGIARRHHLT